MPTPKELPLKALRAPSPSSFHSEYIQGVMERYALPTSRGSATREQLIDGVEGPANEIVDSLTKLSEKKKVTM